MLKEFQTKLIDTTNLKINEINFTDSDSFDIILQEEILD